MATSLHIISNTKTFSKELLKLEKHVILDKLRACNFDHARDAYFQIMEGDWEITEEENEVELISYDGPFEFYIRLYENCLELVSFYKYSLLYETPNVYFFDEFRAKVNKIISIFGGTEVIYLADNGCDKLSYFLEIKVWEGVSYETIKKEMQKTNLPFINDYDSLKIENLSYKNITEFVYDDFKDFNEATGKTLWALR